MAKEKTEAPEKVHWVFCNQHDVYVLACGYSLVNWANLEKAVRSKRKVNCLRCRATKVYRGIK